MIDVSDVKIVIEPALPKEQSVEEDQMLAKTPTPSATGNDRVAILKHELADATIDPQDNSKKSPAGVELAISNVSETTVATAVFEALFYDIDGNVLDVVKHKLVDLQPNRSRAILISSMQYEREKVRSYKVQLTRITTADVEKVQVRKHDISTSETGEQRIHGIVKNISQAKTDASVVLTFYDANHENIGTKVVLLKNIEPDTIRQYELGFKPQPGDSVADYGVVIGEIAAERA